MAAFLTTAPQNKLKSFYPEITNWNFEKYTYGVSAGDIGENAYKKISTRGRKLLNSSQRLQLKTGRKQSRVNLTKDVQNKIANFKSKPGLSFNLEKDRRGDADRTPRIRVRIGKPKPGYTGGKSFTFDASPEGYEQAVKKHNELKKSVGKVQTLEEIGVGANKIKTDYNNLKRTYTDDLVKWINANAANEKYQLKNGKDKLFKDALKEFNKGKYIEIPKTKRGVDAWFKNNVFVKDGRFQFPRDYNFLEGFGTGKMGYKDTDRIFKQFLSYQLLDKNPNFTTTMQDLTDFYTGEKTKTDFTQKELSRLQKFASDNNIGGSSTLGKLLTARGFDFNNKIFEFSKFKTVYQDLANELKQPGLADYRKAQIKTAMSRITRNTGTVLKELKAEYPNLFKSQSMVLEHANPQAFAKTESFFPKNFRLKAQYAPSAFNQLKNINFDQEFVKLSSRFNNETDAVFKNDIKDKIKNLVKNFNDQTKVKGVGYLDDLDIQFGKDKIRVTDKAKLISDLTDRDTIQQVLKNTQHSNQYLKNYPDAKVRLNPTAKGSYPVRDLQLEVPTLKEVSQNPNLTKFFINAKANARVGGNICELPMIKGKSNGGVALKCVDAVDDALEKNPKKLAQEINKSNAGGAFNKIKNSSTKFLTALKENPNLLRGGLPGKIALGLGTVAAGAGAGALVKQFRNDDPSTYLTNEGQMEGMIISDVEDRGEYVENNLLLDNQFKVELAGAAALTAPIAGKVYRTARGVGEAGPLPEGVGRTRAALGLSKGVLGKGLWALGAPIVALPSTVGYVAQDIRAGKDAEEIATNPLNYLGAAFMNPAVKALGKAGASRGLLGIASLGLAGTAAGAVALPAISIGAGLATLGTLGYQGYKLFTGKNRSDEDFFR